MRILLVEDHEDIAESVAKYLRLETYEVDVALDGDKGLKKFQEKFYDMVLLDWMLPGMTGVEICQEIRKFREVPIIMLTAKGQLEDKLEGFACGADDYLVKPFDLDELVVRIRAIMKRFEEPEKIVYHDIEYFPEERRFLKA